MRRNKRMFLLAILAAIFLLSGCSRSSQVENQAYVLVMGLDRLEDGSLQLCVQIPRISGGGASGSPESSESSGNYTQLSIKGDDFETALEKLNWAVPRDLNLSHMKLIVFSRKLAEGTDCRRLIENIAQTERLFTSTRVVVCEGEAEAFVKAIRPVIGTRISTDVDALFDHYTSSGYVPRSSLADLYYQTESVYSDPMITYAMLDEQAKEEKGEKSEKEGMPASAVLSGSISEISSDYKSEIANRYLGAAVFSEGRLCGILDGTQTIIANLLRNDVDAFRYKYDDQSLGIVPSRRAFVHVDTGAEDAVIRIDAKLSISAQEQRPDENRLRAMLENEIVSTIRAAQQMGAEPFGFAEKAAANFRTMEAWKEYNWPERFREAEIDIELSFAYSDT